MKKIVSSMLIVILLLCFCFSGCGSNNSGKTDFESTTELISEIATELTSEIANTETEPVSTNSDMDLISGIDKIHSETETSETEEINHHFVLLGEEEICARLVENGYELMTEEEQSCEYALVSSSGRFASEITIYRSLPETDSSTIRDVVQDEIDKYYYNIELTVVYDDGDYLSYSDQECIYFYFDGNIGLKIVTNPEYGYLIDMISEQLDLPIIESNRSETEDYTPSEDDSAPSEDENGYCFDIGISEWLEKYRENYAYIEEVYDIQADSPNIDIPGILDIIVAEDFLRYEGLDYNGQLCYAVGISNYWEFYLWCNSDGKVCTMIVWVNLEALAVENGEDVMSKMYTALVISLIKIAYPNLDYMDLTNIMIQSFEEVTTDTDNHICVDAFDANSGTYVVVARADSLTKGSYILN